MIGSEGDRIVSHVIKAKFFPILSKMANEEAYLTNILVIYASNEPLLLSKIETFIDVYQRKSYESRLVDFLFGDVAGSKSFVYETLEIFRKYQKNHSIQTHLRTSTQKHINDLLLSILAKVVKGFAVMELAIEVKAKLNQNTVEDMKYLQKNREDVFKKFAMSQKSILTQFNDEGDIEELPKFRDEVEDPVRFKNIFQTYFVREEILSFSSDCKKDCRDFIETKFNQDHCKGTVRNCQPANSFWNNLQDLGTHFYSRYLQPIYGNTFDVPSSHLHTSTKYKISSASDRIYESYNHGNQGWSGPKQPSDFEEDVSFKITN